MTGSKGQAMQIKKEIDREQCNNNKQIKNIQYSKELYACKNNKNQALVCLNEKKKLKIGQADI